MGNFVDNGGLGLSFADDPFGKEAGADAARDAGREQAAAYGLGIDEQRRQFDAVQALLAPFINAGRSALPGLESGAGVEGFSERIRALLSGGALQPLVDERTRAVQQQLAAGGLTRSGAGIRAAAGVPTDIALAIEEALYGRQANLVNLGQSSAVGQANIGSNLSTTISQLLGQQGEARAGGIIGAQQARSAATGQMVNAGLGAAAIFFSDPRLKDNMQPIGKIGPLTLYEWDWKPGVSDVVGKMSIGFSADEVEEHFPELVVEVHGFKAIHYPLLTMVLKHQYGAH